MPVLDTEPPRLSLRWKRAGPLVAAFWLAVLSLSCATGSQRIALDVGAPPTPVFLKPGPNAVVVDVTPFLDARPGDPGRVGRRVHRGGGEDLFVLGQNDLTDLVTGAVVAALQARGFQARLSGSAPADIAVQGRITHFQVEAQPATGLTRMDAKVALTMTLVNRADGSTYQVRTEAAPIRQTVFFRPEDASQLLREAALEAAELLLRDLGLEGRTLKPAR